MRLTPSVLVIAGAFALADARADVRIFVDADAGSGGDGTTWATAFADLQEGLDAAALAGEPVEVWVAAGEYRPDRGTLDRSASFGLLSGVALYGGFAGTETDLSQRDTVANPTVLSGDLRGDDVSGFRNYGDNSVHVVTAFGVDETAVLDGFVVTAGNSNIDGGDFDERIGGAGLFADEASPSMVGCTFRHNSVGRGEPTTGFFGGAVYLRHRFEPMRPRFEGCVFEQNRSISGGAIGVYSQEITFDEFAEYDVRFIDCEFLGNDATQQTGGAVFAAGSPFNTGVEQTLHFERCRFVGNHAGYAGALIVQNPLRFAMIGCELVGNSADVYAGGVWHIQTAQTDVFPAQIIGCTFEGNTVDGAGGALLLNSTRAEVIGCAFLGNQAGAGAGIFTDGYAFGCGDELTVVNSVFSGNSGAGAGVYISCAPLATIAGCTFSQNRATQGSAGLFVDSGVVRVANSVFWGNSLGGSHHEGAQLLHAGQGALSLDYSLVQNLTGGLGGDGNIDADPLFADPDGADGLVGTADDDLTLLAGSPAIDAADNTRVPPDAADLDGDGDTSEATPLDRAGLDRFADDPSAPDTGVPGNGHAEVTDMGAHEAAGGCAADFNADGEVNTLDVLAFLNAWSAGDGAADFNGDGEIDTRDVLGFLNAWGAGCG